MKKEKKHKPYVPEIKRTPSQQAAYDRWWAQIVEDRKRLRKQRKPPGSTSLSLAERIAQKREEIQVQQIQEEEEKYDEQHDITSSDENDSEDENEGSTNKSRHQAPKSAKRRAEKQSTSTSSASSQATSRRRLSSSTSRDSESMLPLDSESDDEHAGNKTAVPRRSTTARNQVQETTDESETETSRPSTISSTSSSNHSQRTSKGKQKSASNVKQSRSKDKHISSDDSESERSSRTRSTRSQSMSSSRSSSRSSIVPSRSDKKPKEISASSAKVQQSTDTEEESSTESDDSTRPNSSSSSVVTNERNDPHYAETEKAAVGAFPHKTTANKTQDENIHQTRPPTLTDSLLASPRPESKASSCHESTINEEKTNGQFSSTASHNSVTNGHNQSTKPEQNKEASLKGRRSRNAINMKEKTALVNLSNPLDKNSEKTDGKKASAKPGVPKKHKRDLSPSKRMNQIDQQSSLSGYSDNNTVAKQPFDLSTDSDEDIDIKEANGGYDSNSAISDVNLISWDSDDNDSPPKSPDLHIHLSSNTGTNQSDRYRPPNNRNRNISNQPRLPIIEERPSVVTPRGNSFVPSGSISLPSISSGSIVSQPNNGINSSDSPIRSPPKWPSSIHKIPRHLSHIGSDYVMLMSYRPAVGTESPPQMRVSSLPNAKTQDLVVPETPRVQSTPSAKTKRRTETSSPRLLNRFRRERKIQQMERAVDNSLQDILQRYSSK